MRMTIGDAINRVAEVTVDNRRELRKSRYQRRTEFTDLYGTPFYAESDSENNAKFYISVSPDLVYMMRMQFKLHIHSYDGAGDGDFSISINGVNITDYLREQTNDEWIDGEGLYPTDEGEEDTDYFDVLDVASLLFNEGRMADSNKLLNPGFKEMVIHADSSFKATVFLYCKYSVTGK